MSHIHIPDGVLPLWLVLAGWLITVGAVMLATRGLRPEDLRRKIPLVGAVAALMLVAMSSEVVPIAYHINLAVMAGIMLGPVLSVPTALIVVSVLALIGHGGVTVIGLNTVVIGAEMSLGALLFAALSALPFGARQGLRAGFATAITLALTTTLLVGIVALGGSPAATRESGAFDPTRMSFTNPFSGGFLGNELVGGAEEPAEEEPKPLDLRRFAIMVYGLGAIGWVLESLITGAIVGFIARVRPSLLAGGQSERTSPPGDEGVHR